MKQKFISNSYSKMYMVSPGVYQKLLNCIDDSEKKSTLDLNKPEIDVETIPTVEPVIENDIVQPEDIIEPGEIIDNQVPGPSSMPDKDENIIIPQDFSESTNNVLATPCEAGEYMKVKEPKDVYGVIKNSAFIKKKRLIPPPSKKIKYVSDVNIPEITDLNSMNTLKKGYSCDICGKKYYSLWSVKRHKNLKHKTTSNISEPESVIENEPEPESFNNWTDNSNPNLDQVQEMEPGNYLTRLNRTGLKRSAKIAKLSKGKSFPYKKNKEDFDNWN